MTKDEEINKLITEASDKIELVMKKISNSPKETRKLYPIGTIGRAFALLNEFQESIFKRSPKLKPLKLKDNPTDPEMTKKQKELTNILSKDKLTEIDNAILSYVKYDYLKVARVVADICLDRDMHIEGANEVFYKERVKQLIKKGLLEAKGGLNNMRFSEIRLAKKS